uniref:Atg6 BARA domain-containing protein n=1 Tax=Ditylum brightwellii TaxID=49249 RepID=A0A7S2EJK0_9STRA|mmetsp:Transcript_32830/g.48893  ORF Transcript_32830/g.48893 Transcript_32830/m.48893 type:complete len:338 (+) Transcript_32830:494-1507(+)
MRIHLHHLVLFFLEVELEMSKGWNVTNDCFYIWHRGPYGTINGLRLGGEVSPLHPAALRERENGMMLSHAGSTGGRRIAAMSVGEAVSSAAAVVRGSGTSSAATADAGSSGAGVDLISMLFSGGAGGILGNQPPLSDSTNSISGPSSASNPSPPQRITSKYDAFKVPWPEINAALGLSALLLDTLQKKPHSGIVFQTHEIMPLGIATKIGVKPDNNNKKGANTAWYNLFYSEESYSAFQFFTKRNFNVALNGLLKCLQDASEVVVSADKALVLPHEITSTSRGEMIIGGLPISYFANGGGSGSGSTEKEGERWTRALKYFLTDLKWVVAYTVKHVDR